jgi:uncharacterized membrane protein
MKKYKTTILVTSLVTLCPMFVGLLLWDRLPDRIATHFTFGNVANGWSSKPFAVFAIPLMLLAIQIVCIVATMHDPKRTNINEKILKLLMWIVPVCSLLACLSCYGIALGYRVNIGLIVSVFVGVIFVVIGNYIHKIKQNYTVGIKLPWTLNSEENWNRTHRFASWVFVLAGIGIMVNGVLQLGWLMVVLILLMIFAPILYSFILYRRGI